ncbi:arginine--tRNA ligase [Isachenkonia alkalipeptolytica]|nr:arginine--tRNA ligase [Isachenkonia alkalipeptolytica]
MDYKIVLTEYLKHYIKDLSLGEIEGMLEVPPDREMGDYAFPCFRLAKTLRKAPNMIAEDLKKGMELPEGFQRVEAKGPYLNFFIDKKQLILSILNSVTHQKDAYGKRNLGQGKTVCIDFSAPNIAKPFHVGHLRSTVIGNALYRIYEALGYNCEGINHLGDWGTQFGKVIVAYRNWGSEKAVKENPIETLLDLYVKFHEEAEDHPELEDQARNWFTRMEQGDREAYNLWKWFSSETIQELKKIYKTLNVKFDHYTGESFYNDKMDGVIKELQEKNLLKESKGAHLVDLEEFNMPPCLVMKKDGSTLYATRDIAAAIYRKKTFDFEKCLYVTDYSQNLHFAQWMKVIDLMGYEWAKDLEHIPFGRVTHEGKKIQTRKGNVVLLQDVLDEAINRVQGIIEEKNPELENKEKVARDIGVGAIIFNDLSHSRIKDVSFSWETAFNFEGETGPYVQYTHARAASILRKANMEISSNINWQILEEKTSMDVLMRIHGFSQAIIQAKDKNEPSIVTRYVVNLAQEFNKFYNECPILNQEEEIKEARLALVSITKQTIKNALYILGIEAPEKM